MDVFSPPTPRFRTAPTPFRYASIPAPYKSLSVRQPWASLIASGMKTIEARSWYTTYRGELLLCASARPKTWGLPTGVAICLVDVVDCRTMTEADEAHAGCLCDGGDGVPLYAWVLERIRPVEPVPVKGRLSFFEVPRELIVCTSSHDRSLAKFQNDFTQAGWPRVAI